MTSNARRSGFRLPWLSGTTDGDDPSTPGDDDEPEPEKGGTDGTPATATADASKPQAAETGPAGDAGGNGASKAGAGATEAGEATGGEAGGGEAGAATAAGSSSGTGTVAAGPPPESQGPPAELLREMVEAMRGVAEQARVSSLADVRKGVEEAVASLRATGGERAAELRRRAEEDVAGIGEWAKAEAERIRREAESKVSGRRTQLEEQLKDQDGRTERGIEAIRGRVTDYERQLTEFFDKLRGIGDPATFAAEVHRMPRPPSFDAPRTDGQRSPGGGETSGAAGDAPSAGSEASSGAGPPSAEAGENTPKPETAHDNAAGDPPGGTAQGVTASASSSITDGNGDSGPAGERSGEGSTMIIVKGLGSFGAITAFKQSLEGTEGIGSVALALGPSGEFVYRATHASGFDVQAAIAELEDGAAEFQREADGTLRVSVAPR